MRAPPGCHPAAVKYRCECNGSALTQRAPGHSFECVPSQSGRFDECLQPQKNSFLDASAVYLTGAKSLPLCEPSQKGCFEDLPQAHQK